MLQVSSLRRLLNCLLVQVSSLVKKKCIDWSFVSGVKVNHSLCSMKVVIFFFLFYLNLPYSNLFFLLHFLLYFLLFIYLLLALFCSTGLKVVILFFTFLLLFFFFSSSSWSFISQSSLSCYSYVLLFVQVFLLILSLVIFTVYKGFDLHSCTNLRVSNYAKEV